MSAEHCANNGNGNGEEHTTQVVMVRGRIQPDRIIDNPPVPKLGDPDFMGKLRALELAQIARESEV